MLAWDPTKDSGRLPPSFVCCMGLEGEICGVQPHLMAAVTTTFFSLGEKLSTLMLCHPKSPLWMKIGRCFGQ